MKDTQPQLVEIMSSEQYSLSEKIVQLKLKYFLSEITIAEIMGITLDEYLEFERGNIGIPVQNYKQQINKLENYIFLNQNEI